MRTMLLLALLGTAALATAQSFPDIHGPTGSKGLKGYMVSMDSMDSMDSTVLRVRQGLRGLRGRQRCLVWARPGQVRVLLLL